MASLEAGDFYASTGVELDDYSADASRHRRAGAAARRHPLPRLRSSAPAGVVETVDGPSARFALTGRRGYARVVVDDSNGAKAWGQPVFLDE